MGKRFLLAGIVFLFLVGTVQAVPITLDFEGITADYAAVVPPGYGGMGDWIDTAVTAVPPENPTMSDNYVAFGLDFSPIAFLSANPFFLRSFEIGSLLGVPGMEFHVAGYDNSGLVFLESGVTQGIWDDYFVLSQIPIFGVGIWAGDSFYFSAVDDIVIEWAPTVTPVPEPMTLLLLGLGIFCLVSIRCKK